MSPRFASFRRLSVVVVASAVLSASCSYSTESSLQAGDGSLDPPTTVKRRAGAATTTVPGSGSTTTSPSSTTTTTVAAENPLSNASKVSVRGIEDIVFGMTLDEAAAVAGFPLTADGPIANANCYVVFPEGGPAGLRFTVATGKVSRLDVISGPITTLSGAGVGMTEDKLRSTFPNQLSESARPGGGTVFTLTPTGADSDKRVIWETDGTKVLTMRAGVAGVVEPSRPCK